MAAMLLPTGPDGLRRFTRESLAALEQRIAEEQAKKAKGCHNTYKNTDPLKPRLDLEAGKQLPRIYGDVPPELIGTPLEDVDPFYYKNQRVRPVEGVFLFHQPRPQSPFRGSSLPPGLSACITLDLFWIQK